MNWLLTQNSVRRCLGGAKSATSACKCRSGDDTLGNKAHKHSRIWSRVVSIVLSAVWVSCQMGVIVSDALDARWAWLWIFDGFWHLLYFLILLAICYLWSPSKNNLQYAYMDELEQDDGGADGAEEEPLA